MTPIFFFALAAFCTFFLSGLYFLYSWIKTGKKYDFLLLWALGFGIMYFFKVPSIIINTGVGFAQEDFSVFFYISSLLRFLAYGAFIYGLSLYTGIPWKKRSLYLCLVWFIGSAIYFVFSFFAESESLTPFWSAHLLFYIPAQGYLLLWLWRAWQQEIPHTTKTHIGVVVITIGTLFLTTACLTSMFVQVHALAQKFWYYSLISTPWISVFQTTAGLCLLVGFYLLAQSRVKQIPKF